MKKSNADTGKNKSAMPEKKKSSAINAAGQAGNATDRTRARSTTDVNGKAGMRDTGTNVSYEDE